MQSQHDNQASGIAREQSVLAMLRALVPNRPLSLLLPEEISEDLFLIQIIRRLGTLSALLTLFGQSFRAEIVRYERLDEITRHKPIITIPIPI